jgi:LEA14-like dessication related protein
MFLSRRRIVLILVIAAVAGAIILLPLILTTTLPADLNTIAIRLSKVEVVNSTNEDISLNVIFSIHNPTQKSLTTSKIEYQLNANNKSLGQGMLSFEDVPVNGRPQLLSNSTTQLKSQFEISRSAANEDIFKLIQKPLMARNIHWAVQGTAQIESGLSSSPLQFNDYH